MTREAEVLIREVCADCDGVGSHRVEASAGHVQWGKKVECATCNGDGSVSRWVSLGELQMLLDALDSVAQDG